MKAFLFVIGWIFIGSFLYGLYNTKGQECRDLGGIPIIKACYKVDIYKIEME